MNIPNLISLARLLAVPFSMWLILQEQYEWAFWVFIAAGASDAIDGYLASVLKQQSAIGSFLDPLADKALMFGAYLTLGYKGELDVFLVVLVIFRDLMIVGGATLLMLFRSARRMYPAMISKLNTLLQILLVGLVLAELGFDFRVMSAREIMIYLVGATTVLSGAWYVYTWLKAIANIEEAP